MSTPSSRLLLATLLICLSAILQTGCAMCCGTYDYAYAGHGGKYQRSDLVHGRIGSPFSDPNLANRSESETLDSTPIPDNDSIEQIN